MSKLPASVGKYKIIDRLGKGGMSVLYKAEHPTLGAPVVIKKLTLKGDVAYRERFRREAMLMMRLRHGNVVGVYDHFKEGGNHYLVMEYIDGRPLSELLAREGALPPKEAAWLLGRIALALAHIHGQGVVHRDLKPSNVLLGRDGSVKLGDFGIAFVPGGDTDITAEGTALGTPSFMAPEQLEDARGADERSDIWSLGVCFFELITGRKFVSGPTPAAIRESLPDAVRNMPGRLPSKLPSRYRRLLRRTLRMRPESRLSSGASAVRLLRRDAGASTPPPNTLVRRLEALLGPMDTAADPTPEAPPGVSPDGDSDLSNSGGEDRNDRSGGGSFLDGLRFLIPSGGKGDDSGQEEGRQAAAEGRGKGSGKGTREVEPRGLLAWSGTPLGATVAVLVLVLLSASLAVSGLGNAVFRSRSYGALRLVVEYPDGAPEYWLDGAFAGIYRETDGRLVEAVSPQLRPSGGSSSLVSRRVSLPAGAYRVRWSLGDKVSWRSFRLPPLRETRASGGGVFTLTEELGDPPEFPLILRWGARDALTGIDLSDRAVLKWERMDGDGSGFNSGGRYRIDIDAAGYASARFDVAVSPWRREIDLKADLWPEGARIVIRNRSLRSVMPRLNGSGRYVDTADSPESTRIGRLPDGEELVLTVAPGSYALSPGLGRSGEVRLELESGATVVVDVVGADNGGERGAVMRLEQ